MPYDARRSDACPASKPWGVFREGRADPLGCHPTEEHAKRQIQAIGARTHMKDDYVDKGDTEGHPFRGNQYTDGGGGADSSRAGREWSQAQRAQSWERSVRNEFSARAGGHPFRGNEYSRTAPQPGDAVSVTPGNYRNIATDRTERISGSETEHALVQASKETVSLVAIHDRGTYEIPHDRLTVVDRASKELIIMDPKQNDTMEHKSVGVAGFKILDDATGTVETVVSVTGIVDRVQDNILPGAYEKTLQHRTPKGVWSHDWEMPIAKTLMSEELLPGDDRLPPKIKEAGGGGLLIQTQFNLDTQRGREAYSDVKFFGEDQEWSVGYKVPLGKSSVNKKTGVREIEEMDLYEYSPVLFGAMPLAGTVSVKELAEAMKTLSEQELMERWSQTATKAGNIEALQSYWTDRMSANDPGAFRDCVDALSDKEGIDNPEALCAWWHNEALGTWPGSHRGESNDPAVRDLARKAAKEYARVSALFEEKATCSECGGPISRDSEGQYHHTSGDKDGHSAKPKSKADKPKPGDKPSDIRPHEFVDEDGDGKCDVCNMTEKQHEAMMPAGKASSPGSIQSPSVESQAPAPSGAGEGSGSPADDSNINPQPGFPTEGKPTIDPGGSVGERAPAPSGDGDAVSGAPAAAAVAEHEFQDSGDGTCSVEGCGHEAMHPVHAGFKADTVQTTHKFQGAPNGVCSVCGELENWGLHRGYSTADPNPQNGAKADLILDAAYALIDEGAMEQKAGRVLSGSNVAKVKAAIAALRDVLTIAGVGEEPPTKADPKPDEEPEPEPVPAAKVMVIEPGESVNEDTTIPEAELMEMANLRVS